MVYGHPCNTSNVMGECERYFSLWMINIWCNIYVSMHYTFHTTTFITLNSTSYIISYVAYIHHMWFIFKSQLSYNLLNGVCMSLFNYLILPKIRYIALLIIKIVTLSHGVQCKYCCSILLTLVYLPFQFQTLKISQRL